MHFTSPSTRAAAVVTTLLLVLLIGLGTTRCMVPLVPVDAQPTPRMILAPIITPPLSHLLPSL